MFYKKSIALRHALNLGTLSLKKDLQLKEVAITGQQKILKQKPDRPVFHVAHFLTASGGDALDTLHLTPGVRIQNSQVSEIGKGAMRIMVDGQILPLREEELTDFLQSLPADDIQRIEVITNLPARYEGEGDSGLIEHCLQTGETRPLECSNQSYLHTRCLCVLQSKRALFLPQRLS